jgi:hypothetical protein
MMTKMASRLEPISTSVDDPLPRSEIPLVISKCWNTHKVAAARSLSYLYCMAILDVQMIDYVSVFVQKYSSEHYNPHVATGVAG